MYERKQTVFEGEPAFLPGERKKKPKKKKEKRRKKKEEKKTHCKKVILNYTETFVIPPSTDKIRIHSETTSARMRGRLQPPGAHTAGSTHGSIHGSAHGAHGHACAHRHT